MKGCPSHGIRRSCRCSDSHTVQAMGASATSTIAASAGATSHLPGSDLECARAHSLVPAGAVVIGMVSPQVADSGSHEGGAREDGAHLARGALERGARILLLRQCAMEMDLQNL